MDLDEQSSLHSTEILRTFGRVNNSMRKINQRIATENDLSLPQFVVLMRLGFKEEMTQKQLGKEMQFPKSTLSQAVDGLVQAQLITRHPVEENRREMQLTMSDIGKLLYQKLRRQEGSLYQLFEAAIQSLSENQSEELLASLRHIAMYLEKESLQQGE